jgi:Raf kinase inhibitor-like YbhB/YbcL family protein
MKRVLILALLLAACRQHREPIAVESHNLSITSSAFANDQPIPKQYGCDGDSIPPPLRISDIPSNAKTLALIVTDPDAPGGLFTHWVVWNIPATNPSIDAGRQGKNSYGRQGYGTLCPPSGSHRYIFDAYALDVSLNLDPSAEREEVESAMKGHIVGHSRLVGTYSK